MTACAVCRVLDAELEALLLSKAAMHGLPVEWVSRLDRLDPERRQTLRVRNRVARSHASEVQSQTTDVEVEGVVGVTSA
jgi:hypothetical protein